MGMSGRLHTRARRADTLDWVSVLRAIHPKDTAKHVAGSIGWPVRTVEKWLLRDSSPNFEAMAALIAAYGPELAAAMMPGCAWLAEAARIARLAAIDSEMAGLAAKRAALARRADERTAV